MKFLLVLAVVSAPLMQAALSKQVANYDLKASLDTKTRTITGSEVLTYVNLSPDAIPTLQFHLYMNAFKNSKTTFFRESGGQLRSDSSDKKEWGWINVNSMKTATGADLTKGIRFIQPDDGNKDDQTVIEVALPEPLKPGATLQLSIGFTTKLPHVFARTGFHGDFYLVGQWFPKLGVWETTGFRQATKPGWNCHQFHGNSEFFANFGKYRAEITLPKSYVIGATGEQQSRTEDSAKGTATYVFEQEDVTDFAWTAQPNYIREERMFVASKETTPKELAEAAKLFGIGEDEAKLSDVKVIVLLQPEHREQMDRHFHAAKAAIKYFGLWYGHYPYKTLTVVDPPYGGGGAGGMEYPTFITAGTGWREPVDVHMLEEVVVHEFGHQFWMQLVATNEFEESPLDEGFNTYSTTKIMEKVYGPTALPVKAFGIWVQDFLGLPRAKGDSINRIAYLTMPVVDDLVRRAWEYYSSGSYGINSYMRTSVTLRTLENILGADTMARVMRTYHQKWRFNHPSARDYADVVNQVSGKDMTPFFTQFVFGNKLLSYRVDVAESTKVMPQFGVFEKDGKQVTVSKEDAEKQLDKEKNPLYRTTVKIQRLGDAVLPVSARITFKDGHVETRDWDGQYRWVKYVFERKSEIASAQIDPKREYQLDVSYADNSIVKKPNAAIIASWSSRVLFWVQNAMLWMTSMV